MAKKSIDKLMFEQLEEKNFDLTKVNQDLRFRVWALDKMVQGLLTTLKESESMRRKFETEGYIRI